MIWVLGGADGLDVNGTARLYDRPAATTGVGNGWSHYGGDAGGNRFSSTSDINTENVSTLALAWLYQTGEELWKGRLPAGGQATPMTYEWEGRQFVVIYAGGYSRIGSQLGDYLVAFALPE